jgi:hypothetical protein
LAHPYRIVNSMKIGIISCEIKLTVFI